MLQILKVGEFYFLKMNSDLTIPILLEKLKYNNGMKKGSLAEKCVISIITNLLTNAINFSEKYSKYYLEEYDDFESYLYKKELLEMETIETINLKSDESLLMLSSTINNCSINDIIGYEDEYLQIINKMLEYINHEN